MFYIGKLVSAWDGTYLLLVCKLAYFRQFHKCTYVIFSLCMCVCVCLCVCAQVILCLWVSESVYVCEYVCVFACVYLFAKSVRETNTHPTL